MRGFNVFELYCYGDGDSLEVRFRVGRISRAVLIKAVLATITTMSLLVAGPETAAEVIRHVLRIAGA
jgi:hypothetical protein